MYLFMYDQESTSCSLKECNISEKTWYRDERTFVMLFFRGGHYSYFIPVIFLKWCLFYILFFFFETVLLCNPNWPQLHGDLPVSAL